MKSEDSGRSFLLSRAVEEPLEATFELGENIKDISYKQKRPVVLGILGHIIFLIFLVPSIYYIVSLIVDGFRGRAELTTGLILGSLVFGLILIFLISITATSIIYLVQIYKFNTFLRKRYSLIAGLSTAETKKEIPEKEEPKKKTKGEGKYLKNPIFAMLDLVEESMHELPQIVNLIRYCTYFIMVTTLFLIITIFFKMTMDIEMFFLTSYWELILGAIAVVLFLPALKLLLDSEMQFRFLEIRHNIIDGVRFEEDITVPEGEDSLKRLIAYLTESDPYIKSSVLVNKAKFREDVVLEGESGKEYRFDAYFSDFNILKEQSISLGMPMGGYAVFIKVFSEDIALNKLKKLRKSVTDVCEKEDTFPLRIIALQKKIKELPDDVYEYVLENPVILKRTPTHIQIAAEDEKVYSFIPMISYGKGVGKQ
ncbi:MAG: hypothetical protein JSW00_08620 [Thermoplasmata archaeon]|nr:MAG: hypothetical protein JSW00_08620 [Thermoplasmata archaeon]